MSDEIFDYLVEFEETFEIEATCTDFDNETKIDPDSHLIKLLKPDGTQSGDDAITPDRESLGIFTQRFSIPVDGPAGIWIVKWVYDVSGEKKPKKIRVKVVV